VELKQIEEDVRNILSEKRYYHSKCVMDVCEELAHIYNVDVDTAKRVGMAHDIAKEMSKEEKLEYIEKNAIYADEIERENAGLLHAKIGADIAIKKYGFTKEMGKAIEAHTTGKPNMGMLSKILYIADWTGIDREITDREEINDLAKVNIDEAILYTLGIEIKTQIEENKQIHIDSILARNYLLQSK